MYKSKIFCGSINPLVTGPLVTGNNFDSKKEGTIEKISYERRAYEFVDDRSHSYVISQKATDNKTRALMD